ncbi:hypothetical protein KHM83_19350 [Fusibacter paucivorans]|uniref:Uncharacterized protein n=1 Tax=Fusibacter paucivorans TaxID=76009 RepID=A0ABS5PUQ3_9FIRM|nr:hypothetical protein [Fusibacter paucivorans]MBS7528828.1 hypothetical protein [Fusibacter paucivorans]
MHTLVDLVYPNFNHVFFSVRCKSTIRFFLVFPTPQSVLNASVDEIIRSFHSSKRTNAWHIDKAYKIIDAVKHGSVAHSAQVPMLSYYAELILHMQDTLNDICTQMNTVAI